MSIADFYDSRREWLRDRARAHVFDSTEPYYKPGKSGNGLIDNRYPYRSMEYLWRLNPNDCVYQVVEYIPNPGYFLDRTRVFIITTGICEKDLAVHGKTRELIINSFRESP